VLKLICKKRLSLLPAAQKVAVAPKTDDETNDFGSKKQMGEEEDQKEIVSDLLDEEHGKLGSLRSVGDNIPLK